MSLQTDALRVLPMSADAVNRIYHTVPMKPVEVLRDLCRSHERLRAELAGAEVLLAEASLFGGCLNAMYVVVWKSDGRPVSPIDSSFAGDENGLLVFPNESSASASARYMTVRFSESCGQAVAVRLLDFLYALKGKQ